ncbi:hypothetical protein P3S67_032196 [Capsicum chacoense]
MQMFLYQSKVSLFGLLETKIKRNRAHSASLNLCAGWSFTTNLSMHKGVSIWMVWNQEVYLVNIEGVTDQLIHSLVEDKATGTRFHVTMIYGFNDQSLRRSLWAYIMSISGQMTGPWVVLGDFNCLFNKEERIGRPVTMEEIIDFKVCVGQCGLQDLRSTGFFYTWSNKQQGVARVYSKIYRVLVNDEWVSDLPESISCFLQEGLYDHCLVLVHWKKHNMSRTRQFRYFNMWCLAPDFLRKIKSSWDERIVGRRMF